MRRKHGKMLGRRQPRSNGWMQGTKNSSDQGRMLVIKKWMKHGTKELREEGNRESKKYGKR